MKHTQYTKSTKFAGRNTAKTPAFKKNQNYSDYWMNDRWSAAGHKFSGLGDASKSNDIVKLIKLSNYRRAITNFVKILTNREIPVQWSGSTSFTNGKAINISTDIKENNFDVTVGLALHEASHIVLTDFDILTAMHSGHHDGVRNFIAKYDLGSLGNTINHNLCPNPLSTIKDLLNWIEDRRIDNYIFKTSPGYKAYYHKLYDYYWNDKSIATGLQSKDYRVMSMHSYMFHIINMINPGFSPKALPGLDTIAKLIDLPNISRLSNTEEAMDITLQVLSTIMDELIKAKQTPAQVDEEEDTNFGSANSKSNSTEPDDTDSEELKELTTGERSLIEAAIRKQEKFLRGETDKKSAAKALQKKLESVADQNIDTQDVGEGRHRFTTLMVDLTKASDIERYASFDKAQHSLYEELHEAGTTAERKKEIRHQLDEMDRLNTALCDYVPRNSNSRLSEVVEEGFSMGALLGKKLLLHNETRERVDVRLQNGKIDAKRLAHAGYGIENIFKQVNISQHRKANLHISLDISGSMCGIKWFQTVKMTAAIVKAITYTQGINVQVGLRTTTSGRGTNPIHMLAYDSRKNNLQHFRTLFSRLFPMDTTPEGLCFEALIKKNMLMKGTNAMDSYFLNISDGEPYVNGTNDYSGETAINHTRAQVNKMRTQLNMKILSFFITASSSARERFDTSVSGDDFKQMYGNAATAIDPNSALAIAKEMNNKFMQS